MFLLEARASTVLYNFLVSNPVSGKYILPINICPIVPLTFLKANIGFEFVDINPNNFRMDEEEVCYLLDQPEQRVSGILYAHPYGESEIPESFFNKIKTKYPGILIIDDRCLCIPEFISEVPTNIDLILYSTGYGKIVDFGSGGYGWTDSKHHYLRSNLPFSSIALLNLEKQYKSAIINQIAIKYTDSDWLETELFWAHQEFVTEVKNTVAKNLSNRSIINEIYRSYIPSEHQFSDNYQTWRFNITVPRNRELIDQIFHNNMFASAHYASLGYTFGKDRIFFNAENLANRVVNLFNDHHYNEEMAIRTCEIVNKHLHKEGL